MATKQKQEQEAAAVWMSVEELIPWEDNPRENTQAIPEVAQSIQRFGFAAPIIARAVEGGGYEIVAGHTRHQAAMSLGFGQVPVRVMDLTEKEARALALADNKIAEIAYWSDDLADLMADMEGGGVELTGLGWSELEIDNLLGSMPSYIGDERIGKIREDGGGKRENNNLKKLSGGSGARVVVLGDFRCVVARPIYEALSSYLEGFGDTQEGVSTLLGDSLEVPRELWQREE